MLCGPWSIVIIIEIFIDVPDADPSVRREKHHFILLLWFLRFYSMINTNELCCDDLKQWYNMKNGAKRIIYKYFLNAIQSSY